MKINLQGKNFEFTDAIRDYVFKKATNLEKLLSTMETGGGEAIINFEVGKSTKHHKSGEVFHSDCLIKISGKEFYSSSDREDLYQTVDEIIDDLFGEITRNKDRKQTLFRRGASSIKKMLKGISKRNPFTSKY